MSIESLVRAVLHADGGLLGTIEAPGDAQVECLVQGDAPLVETSLRYLHLDDGSEHSFAGAGVFARGHVEVDLKPRAPGLFRVRVRVVCTEASLGAAHVVLRAEGGRWVSQIDPPPELAAESGACESRGLYPVLVGNAMLAAPVILYDHPADASERPAGGDDLGAGQRVRLAPGPRADALDVILKGLDATIVSVEQTFEGEKLYCVTIDRDPGKDLGVRGFPGHRFFFRADELERLP